MTFVGAGVGAACADASPMAISAPSRRTNLANMGVLLRVERLARFYL
jgi:hypothetical protein